jgi:hypothetical protein
MSRKRVPLTASVQNLLADRMVAAAIHAASRPRLPDRVPKPGAPSDNARIILAHDVRCACREAGLSDALRYSDPRSLAVELYEEVAGLIWPGTGNSRATFKRMQRANIT